MRAPWGWAKILHRSLGFLFAPHKSCQEMQGSPELALEGLGNESGYGPWARGILVDPQSRWSEGQRPLKLAQLFLDCSGTPSL